MTDAALTLQLRVLSEAVAALADEQRHLNRRLLEREDRRTGTVLLPLLAELVPDAFTAADVLAAALDGRSPAAQALREIVAEYVTEDGGLRAFGRLLARLERVSLAGCRLVRDGTPRGVARWRVRVCRP